MGRKAMGRKAGEHLVHGEWMTVAEAAGRLGIPRGTIDAYIRRKRARDRREPELEAIYERYVAIAEGRMKANPPRLPVKHLVHGEWMDIKEAAGRLGISWTTLRNWRLEHRHPDGTQALMVEAWDHFAAINAGELERGQGKKPAKHWMDGKRMTVREAAEKHGLREKNLRLYMWRHRATLADAVRAMERIRTERAVKEILGIIGEGKEEWEMGNGKLRIEN